MHSFYGTLEVAEQIRQSQALSKSYAIFTKDPIEWGKIAQTESLLESQRDGRLGDEKQESGTGTRILHLSLLAV